MRCRALRTCDTRADSEDALIMARGDDTRAPMERAFSMAATPPMSNSCRPHYGRSRERRSEWRRFFEGLEDDPAAVEKNAEGASWKEPDWPQLANGEIVSALDGNWVAIEKAVGEKIKAKAEPSRQRPRPSRDRARRRATACAP